MFFSVLPLENMFFQAFTRILLVDIGAIIHAQVIRTVFSTLLKLFCIKIRFAQKRYFDWNVLKTPNILKVINILPHLVELKNFKGGYLRNFRV